MLGFIMFVVLILALLLGLPVAWTIAGVASWFALLTSDFTTINLGFSLPWDHSFSSRMLFFIAQRFYGNIMQNGTLLAVPFFVFMGEMLEKSGLAERLLNNMSRLLGNRKGGLAYTVIIVGTILAASTGIVGATVIIMGLIALPSMVNAKYNHALATGVICASATLGQIIPPSIVLVILADQVGISVGDLFVAAIIPGLLLSCGYGVWIFIQTLIHPKYAPPVKFDDHLSIKELLLSLVAPILLIISVLAAIFFGVATPTEAGATGAVVATILAQLSNGLNRKALMDIAFETVIFTSVVFAILFAASYFGIIFNALKGGHLVRDFLVSISAGPYMFLVIALTTMFILGFFIDFLEIVFIVLPIVTPIALKYFAMDPVWFSILVAIVVQTSFLTPPFGFSLFFLKGVAPKHITLSSIYRGVTPYIAVQVVVIFLIGFFPSLVSWLPSLRPEYSYAMDYNFSRYYFNPSPISGVSL